MELRFTLDGELADSNCMEQLGRGSTKNAFQVVGIKTVGQ